MLSCALSRHQLRHHTEMPCKQTSHGRRAVGGQFHITSTNQATTVGWVPKRRACAISKHCKNQPTWEEHGRTRMKQPGVEKGVTEMWMARCSALVLQGNQGGDLGGAREIYVSSTNPRLEPSRVVYLGCPWTTTRLSGIKDVLESILIPNPARSRHFGVGSYTCLFWYC